MSKHERTFIAGVIACVVACAACAALVALDDMRGTPAPETAAEPVTPVPDATGLKPCPRCGGQAAELADWVQTWCRCGECGFRTPARLSAEDARRVWNSCEYYGKPYAGEQVTGDE